LARRRARQTRQWEGFLFLPPTRGGARSSLAPGYFHGVTSGLQLRSHYGRTSRSHNPAKLLDCASPMAHSNQDSLD
jgi:hypothetical protein